MNCPHCEDEPLLDLADDSVAGFVAGVQNRTALQRISIYDLFAKLLGAIFLPAIWLMIAVVELRRRILGIYARSDESE